MQVKVDTRYFPTSQVGNETTLVDTMLNQSQVTIADLLPQTSYYYWIRTICNGDTSVWMGGSSFTTGCSVISISENDPYVENFENYTYNYSAIRPDCWYADSYSPSYTPTVYNYGAYAGNNCFLFRTGGSGSVTYTVLPEFDSDVKHLNLSFMGKVGYSANSGLSVGVMTDKTDFSTFELIATTANSSSWDTCQVSFANYAGSGKFIAMVIEADVFGNYSDYTIDELKVEYSRVNEQVRFDYQDIVCEG